MLVALARNHYYYYSSVAILYVPLSSTNTPSPVVAIHARSREIHDTFLTHGSL